MPRRSASMRCADCGLSFTRTSQICCWNVELHDGTRSPPRCTHCCCGPLSGDEDVLDFGDRKDSMTTDARVNRRTTGQRVTDQIAARILTEFATRRFSVRELADKYQFAECTVAGIVKGKTHTHVPGHRLPLDEIAELGKAHRDEAVRKISRDKALTCKGCGKTGHAITRCKELRG